LMGVKRSFSTGFSYRHGISSWEKFSSEFGEELRKIYCLFYSEINYS
jgi:hypothetical protein